MQSCPGFFLKCLLESPGKLWKNFQELSVKFVDTLYVRYYATDNRLAVLI